MSRPVAVGLTLVVALAVAGGVSGCGASAGSRDQALLASVMRGMKTDLASVHIEPMSKPWGPTNGPRRILIVKSATTKALSLDDWYGQLIATGYNDQCEAKADHCLAVELGPSGGGHIGLSGAKPPYAEPSTLARQIREVFRRAHLRVSSITFEHPNAYAPVVTVRTQHPQRAVYAERVAEVRMPRGHIAGFCIEMLDGRGRIFFITEGTGSYGEGWVRPDLHAPGQMEGPTGPQGPAAP